MIGLNFAYNSKDSLSGYLIMMFYLQDMGKNAHLYFNWIKSGSHAMSVEWLLSGVVDGACIDYLVWRTLSQKRPEMLEKLEIIERLGPNPIQPLILNVTKMENTVRESIKEAFKNFCNDRDLNMKLFKEHGFVRFIALNYEDDYLELDERIDKFKKEIQGENI